MPLPEFSYLIPAHWLAWLTVAFHTALFLMCTVHILLTKRDHVAAFGWVATCLLFPVAGALLYYFFGINRIKTRAKALDLKSSLVTDASILFTPAEEGPAPVEMPALPDQAGLTAHISSALTRLPLVERNSVTALFNAEQAYPDMLAAVRRARHYVYLSTYIFATDRCGREFIAELGRARERGVDVRVLLDGVGEWYSWPHAGPALQRAGVEVARFLPPRLIPPSVHINLRTHRKLLIVDGSIGYAGGMNIACEHSLKDRSKPGVQDVHFRFEGPITAQLEQVFVDDWNFVGRRPVELVPRRFAPRGQAVCRTLVDGPNEDLDTLPMLLTGVISTARQKVTLMTPYFIPPRDLISALQAAALRGVEVNIILPEKSNLRYVDWASRRILPELLHRGVNIHYQPPPFAHSKLYLVDDYYSLIGSANLDPRSLTLNFEVVVETFDRELSAELHGHCERVIARSRRLDETEFQRQALPLKLRDALFWLFSSYL